MISNQSAVRDGTGCSLRYYAKWYAFPKLMRSVFVQIEFPFIYGCK